MKIAVIGAGIVGVSTAYELTRQGHTVTVFERHGSVGEETSFANAGVVAPGYVTPWAAPGMPWKVLRHLLGRHAPVRLGWPSGAEVSWMASWLKACRASTHLSNRERMQRLAFYSREQLHATTARERIEFDRSEGYMVLLRSAKDLALAQNNLQFLRDAGVTHKLLDAEQALALEPALNPETALHAAIHLPQDEVGNCRQYALLLKQKAEDLGVRFAFNTTLLPLSRSQPTQLQVKGAGAAEPFDAVVVCAGMGSLPLLRPLGVHLPMIAVHGYSQPLGRATQRLDGRTLQSVHFPFGPAHSGRWQRRVGWVCTKAQPSGPGNLVQSIERLVPRRGQNFRQPANLERRSTHAARWPAHPGRQWSARCVAQLGPRLQWVGVGQWQCQGVERLGQ